MVYLYELIELILRIISGILGLLGLDLRVDGGVRNLVHYYWRNWLHSAHLDLWIGLILTDKQISNGLIVSKQLIELIQKMVLLGKMLSILQICSVRMYG